MVTIIPAILPRNIRELEEDLGKVWSFTPRVQLDVVDGKFSKIKTVGPEVLTQIDTIVNFDVHLMVEEPERWIERCLLGGVESIYGQVEMMKNRTAFIADTQAEGMGVGLALDIETEVTHLEEVIHDLDAVLLMSSKAGGQGRGFDQRVLAKIKAVRRLSKEVKIIVDGGLDEENIKRCIAALWAEEIEEEELNRSVAKLEFAVGSHLLTSSDVKAEWERLKRLESHT
ncbi:hypothetical protein HY333_01110 [Candidatus Collierbacteria bacterium]|nr:hypothetical protein [Candidatus Collierbacteria bacterium]